MLRRNFLIGTAALSTTYSRSRAQTSSLGLLVYVDRETLWLRALPDGTPRPVATGRRIASPRFSPTGQWISFRDGDRGWIVSTDGKVRKQWDGDSWVPGRDEAAVLLTKPGPEAEAGELKLFTPADNWSAAPASIVRGNLTINEARTQYAWTLTSPNGRYLDGVQRFKTRLLLSSPQPSGEPKELDEAEGYFHIAGFTRSGDWLVYWRAAEMSASLQADGLGLYVANTRTGQSSEAGVTTLVHEDMIAFSPVKDLIAVTSGGRRETWTNKAVALMDLSSGKPLDRKLTEPSVSAQLATWSPYGDKLAWSAGPDAEALHKQQLLARGQKTITVIDPSTGAPKQIPFTPKLSLGAPDELVKQCVRSRRIWVAEIGPRYVARQLTNDPRYSDEEPRWSRDGSHILFCRLDVSKDGPAAITIWLMGKDGSEPRQVAGPLEYSSDLWKGEELVYYGYYGYTDWPSMLDWWQGP
jgi:dipeptidyl aminopeptidase/acylaminoacyl peptidase